MPAYNIQTFQKGFKMGILEIVGYLTVGFLIGMFIALIILYFQNQDGDNDYY